MFFCRKYLSYRAPNRALIILFFFLLCLVSFSSTAADKQVFKPFVLAEKSTLSLDKAKAYVKQKIVDSPFSVIAEYTPYQGAHIFIITSDELKKLASKVKYGGFAAAQRISLTNIGSSVQIAYTNPVYMQHAFRMTDIDMHPVLEQMTKAFGSEEFFGGEGLSARKLKRYKYSFGLEDFDSFYELPEYKSHAEAIAALKKGFESKDNGITEVYQLKIPGKKQVVFGVSMSAEDSGDEALDIRKTMDVVDHLPLKRTAYLPYEIMVDDKKIIALHARFRIAVNFYDLKMFGKHGFGKLFSTPGAYQKAFIKVSGGSVQNEDIVEDGFIGD